MNDIRPMYVQVRSDEWERMKNELQELRGDKAQLEETVAVLQLNAKNNKDIIETCAAELEELRKHEVEWDLAQARIKELETENKSAKDEEINALYQKSLARLHELARKMYPDEEEDHAEADGILCDMLNALGYKDLTDAWDKIGKWYS